MTVKRIQFACIATATLSLAACKQHDTGQEAARTDVHIMVAHRQIMDLTGYVPGRVSPFRQAEIRPQVGGVLEKRLFKEGADVKKGEQLYQIYTVPFEAALAHARADLAHGKAERASADARKRRYTHLADIHAVSHQDYDDAVAAAAQAAADIEGARAEIMTAQVNLDYAHVYAPISGRISRTFVTEGQLVTANQAKPLARITQLDPVYVDLTVNSVDVSRLRDALISAKNTHTEAGAGQVDVVLDNGKTYDHPGRIDLVEVVVDQGTGMTTLRATLHNPEARLLPGMFVHATLHFGQKPGFRVPQDVVLRDLNATPYVLVVGAGGKAEARTVTIAQDEGQSWIITQGLSDGDRIVTDRLQSIHAGDALSVLDAPA